MENNKDELKKLFRRLNRGENLGQIKEEFKELIQKLSATDISQVEEELVKEGMPQEQIYKLCDVHLAVLKEKFTSDVALAPAGHPIHILMEEHKLILASADELKVISEEIKTKDHIDKNSEQKLIYIGHHFRDSESHYVREENVLFPFLERHGITQPPAIMWMEHDKIREIKKDYQALVDTRDKIEGRKFSEKLTLVVQSLTETLSSHFYKENNVLFPTALNVISDDEWVEIKRQFDDLGYCCFTPESAKGFEDKISISTDIKKVGDKISFETGSLSIAEIEAIFNNLPVDITFVGDDDTVRYFSQSKDRIFARARAVIGRTVQQCHPQKSLHKVNQIVEDFKSGKRNKAEFWIELKGRLIYIRYFAVRDKNGEYMGTMEVTQDITDIQKIKGEKRLIG